MAATTTATAATTASATPAPDAQIVVDTAIKNISHIATLPEITLKIIALVEDPASTAQDLHKLIGNDPALCSRILKVVNSAFYGLPRQIGSINRAIVLLGLNAVKNIAIAASLTKLFRGGELCPHFSARNLWTHSMATAAGSKLICDTLKLGLPDEAFLAGLIHDIGLMVEMQAQRENMLKVFDELKFDEDGVPNANMRAIEQKVIGADHCAFGAGLCNLWKFPQSFSYVAGSHHDPLAVPQANRMLVTIINLADKLSAQCKLGFRGDIQDASIDSATYEQLGITAANVESLKEHLPKAFEEMQATFG